MLHLLGKFTVLHVTGRKKILKSWVEGGRWKMEDGR